MLTLPEIPEAFAVKKIEDGVYKVQLKKAFSRFWTVDVNVWFKDGKDGRFYFESIAQSKDGRAADLYRTVEVMESFKEEGGKIGYYQPDPCFCVWWISDRREFSLALQQFFRDLWISISDDIENSEINQLQKRIVELESQLKDLMEYTKVEIREVKR